jgi:class 3 adenylate cyclase
MRFAIIDEVRSLRRAQSAGAKFCDECGAPLTAGSLSRLSATKAETSAEIRVTPQQSDASPPTDGERKTVTALFADIKGSTELMRDLDPEEARAVIDPVLQLMMDAVHRYDGYVVQSAGDGIFALFGAPMAHEDHPQRALHAAIAMRDALRRRAEDRPGRQGVEVRIGINTGEVVLRLIRTSGHTEYTPVGHAANLAARMQEVAPLGGIVISEDTQRLVEGYFELRELGPTEVKGVAESINVYEVIGAGPLHGHFDLAVRRGLTRFVGREREITEIKRALELAASGHGQMVAVVAEAGTGKSRLFYEFKATFPAECKALEAYSVSHGKASAWLPVLALLHDYFGIQQIDDPATRREKVGAALAALDPALSDVEPYLFALLAIAENPDPLAQMDPQVKRKRTMDALKRIVLSDSLKQPIVIIFEDLHWIDGETQLLLDLLADSIANARILLLVNYRPEYRHEWGGKSYYTQLRLDPLGRESTEEVLGALLGDAVELAPLKRLVAEKTGGNPFFIEEMVQTLFDQGAIVRNGEVKVARPLAQLRLPPTVQGILAARIDRLAVEQKDLLQTLAVIGHESPFALIRKIASPADDQLEQMLLALQAGEFIYGQPSAAVEYTFKHALTQEVAYNSLLIERRKVLHERVGAAMESLYAAQLDDHLSELAHHYRHSDNVSKAVEYLGRVGQQAWQRAAYADVISNFSAAIELLERLPDSPERTRHELVLQLGLGRALITAKGYSAPEVEQAFTCAIQLCERLEDNAKLFPALFGLLFVHLLRADTSIAYQLGQRLQQLAQAANDSGLLLLAHEALANVFFFMGNLLSTRQHCEMAISLYDPERHQRLSPMGGDVRVNLLSTLGRTLFSLGYQDQAVKVCNEALAIAQSRTSSHSQAFAQAYVADLHSSRREARATQESAERLIAMSSEQGFPLWLAVGTTLRGWAIAMQGGYKEGIALIREGSAAARAMGIGGRRLPDLLLLADACVEAGQFAEAMHVLTEVRTLVIQLEHPFSAVVELFKGKLLSRWGISETGEAENCFRLAIEIGRRFNAKITELQATTGLARLLLSQGKREEARTMLAEIYNWFTEGFDTADLKDAKALLEELAA